MSTPIKFDTITRPEVVAYLTRVFGADRAWDAFLADCIRDRADFYGLALLPVCYMDGRGKRPLYCVKSVRSFIEDAHARGARKPTQHRYTVVIDSGQLARKARVRETIEVTRV